MNAQERHDDLAALRRSQPAWRLLVADNAPLVIGFLERVFLEPNVRVLALPEILDALEDHLFALRTVEPDAYPKPPEAYLADWSNPQTGWLRRFYPTGSDVPHYEPTAAVETATAFVRSLGPREFLGTASRLLTVRDLLRQITAGAAPDPTVRLEALTRQRDEIDEQIAQVRAGAAAPLDDTAVRERYAQAVSTARELLADLRAVEANFRALDRDVRRRATTWDGPRGDFLATVFGSTDEIGASDQGRSWRAFWEHMLSASQQDELDALLAAVADVPAVTDGTAVANLLRVELFIAAEATQRMVASLSGQLRRFLDEQTWAEGRRINEAIKRTLAAALELRDFDVRDLGGELPGLRLDLALPLERPLYTLRSATSIDSNIDEDQQDDGDALLDLLELSYIDLGALRASVSRTVAAHGGSATLADVVREQPLAEGLAELVGYLQVSEDTATVLADRHERVAWTDATGRERIATLPVLLFRDPAETSRSLTALPDRPDVSNTGDAPTTIDEQERP